MSGSMVVRARGVLVNEDLAARLWRPLDQLIKETARSNNGRVHSDVVKFVEDLRQVSVESGLDRISAGPRGVPAVRTSADQAGPCRCAVRDDLDARQIAALLGCQPHYARRLMHASGVEPVTTRPYRWRAADVAAVLEQRRTA